MLRKRLSLIFDPKIVDDMIQWSDVRITVLRVCRLRGAIEREPNTMRLQIQNFTIELLPICSI